MTAYRIAADVAKVAGKLIASIPEHRHLSDVRVEYLFLDKPPTHGGKIVLGRARRVGGLGAVFANLDEHHAGTVCEAPRPFFVVEIAEPIWRELNADRRKALVDHELMHCRSERNEVTGERVLKIRPHDFEEFAAILRRHGLWTAAAQDAGAEVAEQLALAIDSVVAGAAELAGDDDDLDDM